MEKSKLKIVKKVLKVLGWIAASVLFLLLCTILLIRLPSVQNYLTQKAIGFVESKIGTKVTLDNIFLSFPKKIVLRGLFVEDQSQDTLLYIDKLSIDTDLWELTHNSIQLNTINLENTTAFIKRSSRDSTFNFDYIINAFSDTTTVDTTSVSPWKFSLKNIAIENVKVSYDDQFAGNNVNATLGNLNVEIKTFDLTTPKLEISSIKWNNSNVDILQTNGSASTPSKSDTLNNASFAISVDNIDLQSINLKYVNTILQQRLDVKIGDLAVDAKQIDLLHNVLHINEVELHDSFISYSQYGQAKIDNTINSNSESKSISLPSEWDLKIDKIDFSGNGFQYYDFSRPATQNGFDNAHLWLRDLNLNAENFMMSKNGIYASIHNLSANEKNGLALQSFSVDLKLTNTSFNANDFSLKTERSNLNFNANAEYTSLNQLLNNYEDIKFDLIIANSTLSIKDALYFSPTLLDSVPIHLPKQTSITLSTELHGSVNDLKVSNLYLESLSNTSLSLYGSVKGLPSIDRARINGHIKKFYTTRVDVKNILGDSLIPSSIQIPEWLDLAGEFNGTIHQPQISALIKSDIGELEGKYKSFNIASVPSYDATITTRQFNVGRLLKQEDMGILEAEASIKGAGFSIDSIDAVVDLNVKTFAYKKYNYNDFRLNGTLKNYFFSGRAILKDKNLDFELEGNLSYETDAPHYSFKFNLANADFQALHLSQRPLKARAILEVDIATSDLKIVNGKMGIRNVAIYNGDALYKVDSLLFASIDQQGKSELSIRSDIISGDFKGTFNIFEMPAFLRQHINQYFELHDNKPKSLGPSQNFTFDLILKNTDLLTEIIFPELDSFVPGKIQGAFNSEKNTLSLGIEIAKIKYATTSLDSFTLNIDSDKNGLIYSVKLREFHFNKFRVSALRFQGDVAKNVITTKLLILDSLNEDKYSLAGQVKSVPNGFQYSFIPDQILLNYKDWVSPVDNYLQVAKNGVVAHNFNLTREGEKFSVLTSSKDSTITFDFLHWKLANLTQLVEGKIPAEGELNGDFKLTTSRKGEFNSKLQINNLSILEKSWGDASLALAHNSDRYTVALKVKGENGNIDAKGYLAPKENFSIFDFDIRISPFDLSLIEPLSNNQFKNVTGFAKGDLKLTGNTKAPSIRGKITFTDVNFLLTYLNNSFTLQNETIAFEESGIVLNNFKIKDEKNNVATIKGNILTKMYKDFDFDLRLTTQNFQLLNTKESDNPLYYGYLRVNANAHITGNINQPAISGALKIGNESQLTYVVPSEKKSALEQKDIVQFVSKKEERDPFLKNIALRDTTQTLFRGMDVDATIELTDAATLNIVIDPTTGDKLSLKGNSTLVYTSDASGSSNLSGRFEITSGTYNFTFYKLVKREFNIVKGSSITWSGDPLNADMDIRALYEVETSPLDLVYNQISTTNQSEIDSYNKRLPFLVYMNINGKLLVPEITFKLDMPDDKRNVFGGAIYSKLQDINTRESDLNKQVFALLILKRFISDNPFESQASSSINNTARMSVSRLLSEQLNRLSQNVKGVQLSFDIKSSETNQGGEAQGQTKLQLGLSKNLFNDRLVVKIAGNVDLEGENTNQKDITEYIGDLALEFKLTPDGRFRLTGFRNSNYDMIDGELTETGVGLIYIKDYNTFQELFKSNAKSN